MESVGYISSKTIILIGYRSTKKVETWVWGNESESCATHSSIWLNASYRVIAIWIAGNVFLTVLWVYSWHYSGLLDPPSADICNMQDGLTLIWWPQCNTHILRSIYDTISTKSIYYKSNVHACITILGLGTSPSFLEVYCYKFRCSGN